MSSKIQKLFVHVHKIPQIPEVIHILMTQINQSDVDINSLASNIEKEQIISVKVLRMVNSAYFNLPKKVLSIKEAVVLLGINSLKSLITASAIVSAFPKIENFDIKAFWKKSFRTASYAKWLAKQIQIDRNIAFTIALISDLGSPLIHLGLNKEALEITKLVDEGHGRPFIEKMRLGFITQEVSAKLCTHWQLPDALITPITQSATPLEAEPVSKMACLIYIARFLSECKSKGLAETDILQSLPLDITNQLALSTEFFEQHITGILSLESELDTLIN